MRFYSKKAITNFEKNTNVTNVNLKQICPVNDLIYIY